MGESQNHPPSPLTIPHTPAFPPVPPLAARDGSLLLALACEATAGCHKGGVGQQGENGEVWALNVFNSENGGTVVGQARVGQPRGCAQNNYVWRGCAQNNYVWTGSHPRVGLPQSSTVRTTLTCARLLL